MKTRTMDLLSTNMLQEQNILSAKLLSIFESRNMQPEHFYLTGFEDLCIEANHSAMSEALISSVIPFDGELLIIGNTATCATWRAISHRLDVTVSVLDGTECNIADALEAILTTNKNITHVMCTSERDADSLRTIGRKTRQFRRSFIVDNCNDSISMSDVDEYGIDFLMTAADDSVAEPMSIIVARRSKLVQTEGNARSATHDIYALWQELVGVRHATLEPMA